MRRVLELAGLLSVAACGTLSGHALAYLLEGRSMDDARHGYFTPVLEVAGAALLLCAVLAAARMLAAVSARRGRRTPPLSSLCVMLAALQVAGFATMEFLEGNPPDPIGCGVEILIALLIAVAVSLVLAFVERCVAPILTTYLRRRSGADTAVRRPPVAFVRPPLLLAICAGVRRFKRPPPLFG